MTNKDLQRSRLAHPKQYKRSAQKPRNVAFTLRTDVKKLPDLGGKTRDYLAQFSKCKDVFYIHFTKSGYNPEAVYKQFVDVFRQVNSTKYRRLPQCGLRFCNVYHLGHSYHFVSDVICLGSLYTSVLMHRIIQNFHPLHTPLFIRFRKPGRQTRHNDYKAYYATFQEFTHEELKVEIQEPYFWRIDAHTNKYMFLFQFLFNTFGDKIETVYVGPYLNLAVSQSSLIDEDDYYQTCRESLDIRIRLMQPFGRLFDLNEISVYGTDHSRKFHVR